MDASRARQQDEIEVEAEVEVGVGVDVEFECLEAERPNLLRVQYDCIRRYGPPMGADGRHCWVFLYSPGGLQSKHLFSSPVPQHGYPSFSASYVWAASRCSSSLPLRIACMVRPGSRDRVHT